MVFLKHFNEGKAQTHQLKDVNVGVSDDLNTHLSVHDRMLTVENYFPWC